eukprot:175561-Pleurochrysis_carterae.AAC.1
MEDPNDMGKEKLMAALSDLFDAKNKKKGKKKTANSPDKTGAAGLSGADAPAETVNGDAEELDKLKAEHVEEMQRVKAEHEEAMAEMAN